MEPTQPEPTLEESVAQVMQNLPPVIRTYVAQGRYTTVSKNLMAKYGLRIDQGGVLEREIMLLLIGVETPEEFVRALSEEAGLNTLMVDNIAHDVNDQIFVPLREEERRASAAAPAPQPTPAIAKAEPQMQPAQQARPAYGAPLPPRGMMPVSSASLPAKPMLLEDHEEPHMELGATSTAQIAQIAPRSAQPPTNLPGASMPTPARAPAAQPRPGTVITAYTSDPYREPIDDTN